MHLRQRCIEYKAAGPRQQPAQDAAADLQQHRTAEQAVGRRQHGRGDRAGDLRQLRREGEAA